MNNAKWLIVAVTAFLSVHSAERNIEARPIYQKVFIDTYENEFAAKIGEIKNCAVCHLNSKDPKSLKNYYGKAMAESLGNKKISDMKEIRAALRDAEKKPSNVEGKTFGDLIKEGRLPASK
jgi:hypothetical protein